MRARHASILFAAAIALLLVAGPRLFLGGPGPSPLPAKAEPFRVELRRPREDVVLERRDGRWLVVKQDDLADAEAVELLISGLRSLDFSAPAAKGKDAAAYGLGPADSARVRVIDAKGILQFDGLFGRRVFTRSAYFRASERGAVTVASGLDPELLQRSSLDWREPRLLPGGCADGLELRIAKDWVAAPADLARELCALRAAGWAEGAEPELAGFDKPLLRARARDGRAFEVGDRRGSERLVRVEGRAGLLRAPAAPLEAAAYLLRSLP